MIILVLVMHETYLAVIVCWASILENFISDLLIFLSA